MKLASVVDGAGTARAAVLLEGGVGLLAAPDVGSLLASGTDLGALWVEKVVPAQTVVFGPVVPRPAKILCVGLNYRRHIEEMGREIPEYPTVFAKFSDALIGPQATIEIESSQATRLDWEGELAVVVGRHAHQLSVAQAAAAIAGYTLINDVTARDLQRRTTQWLQGKTLPHSAPLGPALLTPEQFDPSARLETTLNGAVVQSAPLSDLVFPPAELVSYISAFTPLSPGDVIATGTPGGVGDAMTPQRYLRDGDRLTVRVPQIGALENEVRLLPDTSVEPATHG